MPARRSADHPRSRGENPRNSRWRAHPRGSSPLTRGKPGETATARPGLGIIPAHAGKTARSSLRILLTRDHPRSRGENVFNYFLQIRARGSSPLTRGKPSRRRVGCRRIGIIPAHAGKTYHLSQRSQEPWDHPRSRGENCVGLSHNACDSGSSPLTRGKQTPAMLGFLSAGIIPAHAGKTQ